MAKTKDLKKVEDIIKHHRQRKSGLVAMLQDVQNEYSYLPREVLICIAEKMGIPISQAYSLATFYKSFSLRPRGKYLISLCMGTACHVRGAERILEELKRLLKIKPGQTTKDLRFSLETVNCLGACALGPLLVVNGKYYAKMNAHKVDSVIKEYTHD